MNPKQFRESLDELHSSLVDLTETKGQEYKGGEDTSQFANFDKHAATLGMTREQVLYVYLAKHLDSITTYIKDRAMGRPRQLSEPIEGRIKDAILYLWLLRGMTVDSLPAHLKPCPIDFSQPKFEQGGVKPASEMGPRDNEVAVQATPAKTVHTLADGTTLADVETIPPVILSTDHHSAVEECRRRGLPPATHALSALDQLYGRRGGRVILLHHGTPSDDALGQEARVRCKEQGLAFERIDVYSPV